MTCIAFSSRPSSVDGRQAHSARIDRREPDIVNTINRLGSHIRYLGLLLKSFSTLNYQLPYLDEFGFVATFKSGNKHYVSVARQHQALVSHYKRGSIDRYLEQRPLQNGELFGRIEDTIEKVKSALKTFLDLLDRIEICHDRCLDYVVQLRREIEQGPEGLNRQNWNACTDRLSQTLGNAREWMRNQKQESLEEVYALDPYYDLLPERPFYESLGPDAGEVLDEQYFAGCLMRGRREFEWLDKTLEDIYKTYRSEWNLPKEDFKELAFLKRIIQPDRLKEAMEILYDCQDAAYARHAALISRLKQDLGEEVFAEAIRVQKAMTIYKKWQSVLNGCIRRHSGNHHDRSSWAKAYTITQLLSYEKTRFMTKMFDGGQDADAVVKGLETYVFYVKNKSPREKLAFLQRVRKRCLDKNRKLEEALYQLAGIQSVCNIRYVASLFGLAITEQPVYKMARLVNQTVSEDLYRFGKDDIPEKLQYAGGHLAGVIVLSSELRLSSWLGGSYALISSLNRCLFAHLNTCIRGAESVDALSQRVLKPMLSQAKIYTPELVRPGISWLQEGVRWDEEGLRHKEAYLQRLSELLIAIGIGLIGGQHVLPTAVAFSLARLLSDASGRATIWTLHKSRLSNRSTAEKIGYFIQFLSYPLVYQYGFQFGDWMFPEKEEMSVSEALDVLGLSSSATDREIREARHDLMFKYHPDKNIGAHATHVKEIVGNFQRVQAAYEVLQKKK